MDDFLHQTFERLIDATDLSFKRSLYERFQLSRLTCLIGARGVGKTTLLLQYIKENLKKDSRVFYFSADSVYFRQTTLLKFINDLYHLEGYRVFFIDEIHQYADWAQEIKNLYDAFPDMQIVYSGSSMLELKKGSYDLSRRVRLYRLPGMSFREYLSVVEGEPVSAISLAELLSNPRAFNHLGLKEKILGHFKTYLAVGYYPFLFEEPHTYYERILRIVEKIIHEDIPSYYDLKTEHLPLFKKLLAYVASIPPGELNTNNIAKNIGVAHQTIAHYLVILESVGLLQMVYPFNGGSDGLRKPQKIFLQNTTLLSALQQVIGEPVSIGTLRELYFIQALRDADQPVFYAQQGDYQTHHAVFEVGGKNKKGGQLAKAEKPAFVVKDDITTATQSVLPLFYLGFVAA